MHICYVVTCEYFHTPLWRTYRYIIGPTAVILLTSLTLSGLLLPFSLISMISNNP